MRASRLMYWKELIKTVDNLKQEIEISLVGKYTELHDAYLSVVEALNMRDINIKLK